MSESQQAKKYDGLSSQQQGIQIRVNPGDDGMPKDTLPLYKPRKY